MIVAFLESFEPGDVIEPPRHVHITVKKKFKIISKSEAQLIELLRGVTKHVGMMTMQLGESKIYDDDAFKVLEVLNEKEWRYTHVELLTSLKNISNSRDEHLEGENYYPHVSWMVRNQTMFDPAAFINTSHELSCFYLMKRVHQTKSIVEVIAKLPLKKATQ